MDYAETMIRRTNGGRPDPTEIFIALNIDIGHLGEILLYFENMVRREELKSSDELLKAMRAEPQFMNAIASIGIHLLDFCILLDKDFGAILISAVESIVRNSDSLKKPELPGEDPS